MFDADVVFSSYRYGRNNGLAGRGLRPLGILTRSKFQKWVIAITADAFVADSGQSMV